MRQRMIMPRKEGIFYPLIGAGAMRGFSTTHFETDATLPGITLFIAAYT